MQLKQLHSGNITSVKLLNNWEKYLKAINLRWVPSHQLAKAFCTNAAKYISNTPLNRKNVSSQRCFTQNHKVKKFTFLTIFLFGWKICLKSSYFTLGQVVYRRRTKIYGLFDMCSRNVLLVHKRNVLKVQTWEISNKSSRCFCPGLEKCPQGASVLV